MLVIAAENPAAIGHDEALTLYTAVGWTAYTRDPGTLMRGIAGAHRVVTARREGRLVGLARAISDGATIVYVQDVLVAPEEQRHGIGRRLLDVLFEAYEGIRQQVLLTDTEQRQRDFYERLGFVEAHDHTPQLRAFIRRN